MQKTHIKVFQIKPLEIPLNGLKPYGQAKLPLLCPHSLGGYGSGTQYKLD